MWQNRQFSADLVTFTEEILNGKLHFLCVISSMRQKILRKNTHPFHCLKSVRIRSYSGTHFPAFGLNSERYSVSLHIQSECGKIWTRITPNTNTFYAVYTIFYDTDIFHPDTIICPSMNITVWTGKDYRLAR